MSRRRPWPALVALFTLLPIGLASVVAWRVHLRVLASLHPPRLAVSAPAGLRRVRDVRLMTSDGVAIRGWYVPSRNGAAVILGHGWAGQRTALMPEARTLAAAGYGVAMFDWRGHGESGGARTTWGVDEQRDLSAVLGYVASQADVDPSRIGVIGFSMGGMVVAQVAERDPRVRAVVLEGTFTSLEDEMKYDEGRWGWLSGSVAVWTLRREGIRVDRERPIDAMCRISPRPLLVVGGTSDEGLPVSVARQMYTAACAPKRLLVVPGAAHGEYERAGGRWFERELVSFFDAALRSPSGGRRAGRRRFPPGAPLDARLTN